MAERINDVGASITGAYCESFLGGGEGAREFPLRNNLFACEIVRRSEFARFILRTLFWEKARDPESDETEISILYAVRKLNSIYYPLQLSKKIGFVSL